MGLPYRVLVVEFQVIIVGLGIAGLVAAIECPYKGHVVVGLERGPGIRVLGRLCDTKSVVHGSPIDWSRRQHHLGKQCD
ncbi:unnamed protein product [Penicillium egyptiacum]|uniref:Uncharacterized protein n=1 Tax=Penicillium egyptiacum TaxID=1303716 RepID=A0A9W4KIK1_9EURO|nr:unnamed protein product [Penicillium egyptiacum]